MKRFKIKLSFGSGSDSKFLSKASFISSSMKNNADTFKNPQPTLKAIDDAIATYAAAFYQADGGSKQDVKNKNTARTILENLLFSLGLWVMYYTDCTEDIKLSGFDLVKEPQPRKLEGISDLVLIHGLSSGEIIAQVPKGNGTSFNFEITDALPDENTVWKVFSVSTSQYTFTNLVAGRQYYVRVAAVAGRKQLVYSSIGTQTAKI